jgi:hypothetical protein
MNWNKTDIDPPDEMVEVKDSLGNIANAYPCFYPFTFEDGKVIPCEPTRIGWAIQGVNLKNPLEEKVVAWREII